MFLGSNSIDNKQSTGGKMIKKIITTIMIEKSGYIPGVIGLIVFASLYFNQDQNMKAWWACCFAGTVIIITSAIIRDIRRSKTSKKILQK
jgi:hypothetical protein